AAGPGAVLRAGSSGRGAGRGAGAAFRRAGAGGMSATEVRTGSVSEVLDRALAGERISDDDARLLPGSRELVRIGRAAHQLRCRKAPADRVTFVIDRKLNYTNAGYTQ